MTRKGTSDAWNLPSSSSKSESKLICNAVSYSISSLLSDNSLTSDLLSMISSSSSDIWMGRFLAMVKNGIVLFEELWKLISLHTIVLFLPRKRKIGNFCYANFWANPNAAKCNSSSKLYLLQLHKFW